MSKELEKYIKEMFNEIDKKIIKMDNQIKQIRKQSNIKEMIRQEIQKHETKKQLEKEKKRNLLFLRIISFVDFIAIPIFFLIGMILLTKVKQSTFINDFGLLFMGLSIGMLISTILMFSADCFITEIDTIEKALEKYDN